MARTSRWKEGGIGRKVSFSGFWLLFICFFLPQVRACDEPFIPVAEVYGGKNVGLSLDLLVTMFLPFAAAFLASIIYLLRFALRPAKARRILTAALCVLALLVLLYGSIGLATLISLEVWEPYTDPDVTYQWDTEDTALAICLPVMLTAAALAVAAVIRARRPAKTPAALACLGAAFAAYFLTVPVSYPPLYGIWLSIAASGLIAVGGLWEALATRRLGRVRAAPGPVEGEP
ncbi:MAG: hypothetical protein ACYS8X_04480 [Planctomycetota bacterium]